MIHDQFSVGFTANRADAILLREEVSMLRDRDAIRAVSSRVVGSTRCLTLREFLATFRLHFWVSVTPYAEVPFPPSHLAHLNNLLRRKNRFLKNTSPILGILEKPSDW
jgi:hypothetical protein